ncbi:hypothetical protein QTP86_034351 [Hemibagrus guttatus]|nr:hypothetical protein QTP86_034351 [Hemibagrus guttatus]
MTARPVEVAGSREALRSSRVRLSTPLLSLRCSTSSERRVEPAGGSTTCTCIIIASKWYNGSPRLSMESSSSAANSLPVMRTTNQKKGIRTDQAAWFRALVGGCFPPSLRGFFLPQLGGGRRSALLPGGARRSALLPGGAPRSPHLPRRAPRSFLVLTGPTALPDFQEWVRVGTSGAVIETRWKGSKARSIGAGFKLFYYGVDSKRNGVGVVLKEEFVRNVLEVKRVSDRVMSLKLEIEGVMLNVVSGYAPQVGCELEEKERFWSELDEVMESIPTGERVMIGADFNGHVGEGNRGDEEVMGKFGVKERNLEGQLVVDFSKRMDMAVVNTYFQKREEHRVTYKSGGRRTQVDYILCRRGNLKEISDCKVVVGESVARQHRMVVCRMTLMVCKTKRSEIEKKTKWRKLKKEECCEEFRQKLRQALGGQVVLPDDWETTAEMIREKGAGLGAYDRVPREELWYCMRKSGVAEKYVRVVQDMYERSRTVVRCAVGQTEEFNVEGGLHQGSALSPFLFAIVMDQLSEEVRQESPWTMMFADGIVICSESREQVEENLERWRFALERRGMKVSRSKTEYMCVNEREGSGTVRLQGEEVKKVQEFKYLGSTVQSNGECGKEVKKRVQAEFCVIGKYQRESRGRCTGQW